MDGDGLMVDGGGRFSFEMAGLSSQAGCRGGGGDSGSVAVIACNDGCLHGDIARMAAKLVAREREVVRGGAAGSGEARGKVMVVDRCLLASYRHIFPAMVGAENLIHIDELSGHHRYANGRERMSEAQRQASARTVADRILRAAAGHRGTDRPLVAAV